MLRMQSFSMQLSAEGYMLRLPEQKQKRGQKEAVGHTHVANKGLS